MGKQADFVKVLRKLHLYIGAFIAPSILFFAVTGALQTFSLHDCSRDGTYRAPEWIVVLAQVHKKQIAQTPVRKSGAPSMPLAAQTKKDHAKAADVAQPVDRPAHDPLPLKIFFVLVSIGLVASTVTGLYMSWTYGRNRVVISGLLLAGIVVPIALLLV